MKEEKKEGIILRSIDYQDSSKILHIFTKNGLESLLVRNAKRMKSPYKSFSQTYNIVSYSCTNSKLNVLVNGEVIDYNEEIKNDYYKCLKLSKMVDILNDVVDPNELLYNFFISSVKAINKYDDILLIYYLKMTYFFGVTPQIKCHCGREIVDFNIDDGNGLCEIHASRKNPIAPLLIRTYNLKYGNNYKLSTLENRMLLEFINRYYYVHMDRKIKI